MLKKIIGFPINIINSFAAATSTRFQVSRLRNEMKIISTNYTMIYSFENLIIYQEGEI